jgi:hypothetical protein
VSCFYCYAVCLNTDCHVFIVLLSVVMLSVVMLSIAMLGFVMLSVMFLFLC